MRDKGALDALADSEDRSRRACRRVEEGVMPGIRTHLPFDR
jgi:hypothetical protein